MKQTFYSNGKLLITGEYVVLDGALALALPTTFGQYLHIEESGNKTIKWISKDADGAIWLQAEIPFTTIVANKQESGAAPEINTLTKILHEAFEANPLIINNSPGFVVTTELTFPRQWGLGTSSTLINNIAQWFCIDAFGLLNSSFGGSGYDIACAQNNTAVLYKLEEGKPVVEPITYIPAFADKLYFVYLNKKQNSRSAINSYKERKRDISDVIAVVDKITRKIVQANGLASFQAAAEKHEAVLSGILGRPSIKDSLFPDFNGTIKSLGAWGGDFVLAASDENPTSYFKAKGFEIVIPYEEMILKK